MLGKRGARDAGASAVEAGRRSSPRARGAAQSAMRRKLKDPRHRHNNPAGTPKVTGRRSRVHVPSPSAVHGVTKPA